MAAPFSILYIAEADREAAVLASGTLAYLVEAMPHASFTIVGSPETAPLFADTPRLNRLMVLESEAPSDWIGLWNRLRHTRWGLIVDMRGSGLSARLRRDKRAVRGKDKGTGEEPGLHAVEAAARVLKLDDIPAPRLIVGEETQAIADAVVRPDGRPILAVGPGTDWIGKCWPAERYSKIAAALLGEGGVLAGGRLLILGDEEDRDLVHTIRLAVPRNRVIEAHGRLTPLQACAALKHAALYIGADSLWTQLAVAAGIPVIGVFGPSDETRVGPWGGTSIRGPRSLAEYRELDPRLNQAIQHMMDLPADRVLKAAKTRLALSSVK